jgi:hypothetical protein
MSAPPRQRQPILHKKEAVVLTTVGAINAHNTLVADALDECAIEIPSLKCNTEEKSHILGNGKMYRVPKCAY